MIAQDRLRARAADLQTICVATLEIAQLREAVHEAEAKRQGRSPAQTRSGHSRACSVSESFLQRLTFELH